MMEDNDKNAIEESQLLNMLSQGNESAFREIYQRYHNIVYAAAYRFLKSREHAQEILQEVFTKVWNERKRFAEVRNAAGYIQRIARNVTIDYSMKLIKAQAAQYEFHSRLSQIDDKIEHKVLEEENDRIVSETLATLHPSTQEVFKLSRFEGLNSKDIAHRLNISVRTVERHILKASDTFESRLKLHIEAPFY